MNKPYKTIVENILWCIENKGPIDLQGVADELQLTDQAAAVRSLSGPLSNVFTCLGEKEPYGIGWVSRKMDAGRYFYSMKNEGKEKSIEVLYDKYRRINRTILADRIARKKGLMPESGENDKIEDNEENGKGVDVDLDSIQGTIQQTVKDAVERTFGINVEVSGRVEILFGWKKD